MHLAILQPKYVAVEFFVSDRARDIDRKPFAAILARPRELDKLAVLAPFNDAGAFAPACPFGSIVFNHSKPLILASATRQSIMAKVSSPSGVPPRVFFQCSNASGMLK